MTIHTRQYSSLLQAHLDGSGTTLCYLLKITTTNGTVFGITSLDQDVPFNDGEGEIVYSAAIGMDQSAIDYSADLEVDNAEATIILEGTTPFSPEGIETGQLDYSEYVLYRVNWANTADGPIEVSAGTLGAVKAQDGIRGVIELRGLSQTLKQNIVEVYSLTCRARFGGGSYGDTIFKCNFDATTLWGNYTVDSLGAEVNREFTATVAPTVNGPNGPLDFVPGLVEWLTGANTGLTFETIEVIDADITLRVGLPFNIQVGDTFKIRPDCDKSWEQCRDDYENILNFRGEPRIPVGDEGSGQTPGGTYPLFTGFGVVDPPEIP